MRTVKQIGMNLAPESQPESEEAMRPLRHERDDIVRINSEFKQMPRVPDRFTEDQLDHAADCIDLPVEKVLTSIDQLNNEIMALSFFVSETWRLMVLTGESPANDEFAIRTAPIMRRIRDISLSVGSTLAGLQIDAEMGALEQG